MSSYKKNSTYSNVEFCLQAKKKKNFKESVKK